MNDSKATFSVADIEQLRECARIMEDEGYHEKCRFVFDAADTIERLQTEREKILHICTSEEHPSALQACVDIAEMLS